jgi:voltage-gated potassium channel
MRFRKHLFFSVLFFVIVIIAGALAYSRVEGWNLLDSFYFVVVTLTTIGYGDFVPVTSAGKIFTMFYAFFGVGMALYFLSLLGSSVFKKHVSEKVSEIKREVKKDEEIKQAVDDVVEGNAKRKKIKKKR